MSDPETPDDIDDQPEAMEASMDDVAYEYCEGDDEYDEDDDELTPEQVEKMISGIRKHMPDMKLEVNGKVLTAEEVCKDLEGYLEMHDATEAARLKYEEALTKQMESEARLEAAIRANAEKRGNDLKN